MACCRRGCWRCGRLWLRCWRCGRLKLLRCGRGCEGHLNPPEGCLGVAGPRREAHALDPPRQEHGDLLHRAAHHQGDAGRARLSCPLLVWGSCRPPAQPIQDSRDCILLSRVRGRARGLRPQRGRLPGRRQCSPHHVAPRKAGVRGACGKGGVYGSIQQALPREGTPQLSPPTGSQGAPTGTHHTLVQGTQVGHMLQRRRRQLPHPPLTPVRRPLRHLRSPGRTSPRPVQRRGGHLLARALEVQQRVAPQRSRCHPRPQLEGRGRVGRGVAHRAKGAHHALQSPRQEPFWP